MSHSFGVVPINLKRANITKMIQLSRATTIRPTSQLCVLSKVLERCVHSHSYYHLAPHIYQVQHGFVKGKSTTKLLECTITSWKMLQVVKKLTSPTSIYPRPLTKYVPHNLLRPPKHPCALAILISIYHCVIALSGISSIK